MRGRHLSHRGAYVCFLVEFYVSSWKGYCLTAHRISADGTSCIFCLPENPEPLFMHLSGTGSLEAVVLVRAAGGNVGWRIQKEFEIRTQVKG